MDSQRNKKKGVKTRNDDISPGRLRNNPMRTSQGSMGHGMFKKVRSDVNLDQRSESPEFTRK